MEDVKTRDVDKFALFKKIQQNKALLFGKFSNTVTRGAKDAKWEEIRLELVAEGHPYFEDKTAKQIKDNLWALSKSRTIAKVDQAKKTGSDGVPKFSDVCINVFYCSY
ncbi:myb/SANT-like DNA-binding domain-containing protein [Ditylenchus destructor]|uniref:Regulatory protein zeste n=1 Tax=Ditylenchus destructor TaxID=166010 RepID=A0AAD4QX85_9BILA|nr:myb/SANT-like DNA-binding domain-containing protein [Ditylenchus destructor]